MVSLQVQLLVVGGAAFVLGGLSGSYVERLLSGADLDVHPQAATKDGAQDKGTDCPVCPTVADCGAFGAIPLEASPVPPPTLPDETLEGRDGVGLAASILTPLQKALMHQLGTCVAIKDSALDQGLVVLDLTVTASVGQARITDSRVSQRSSGFENQVLEQCLEVSAVKVTFPWPSSDGQLELKIPLDIGRLGRE